MSALVPERRLRSVEHTDPSGSVDVHSEQRAPAAAQQLTFTAKYEEHHEQEARAEAQEKEARERRSQADDRQRLQKQLHIAASATPQNRALLAATDTENSTNVHSQDVTQRGQELAASHRVEIRKEFKATSSDANATQSSLYEGGAAESMNDGNDPVQTPAPMGDLGERSARYSVQDLGNADQLEVHVEAHDVKLEEARGSPAQISSSAQERRSSPIQNSRTSPRLTKRASHGEVAQPDLSADSPANHLGVDGDRAAARPNSARKSSTVIRSKTVARPTAHPPSRSSLSS